MTPVADLTTVGIGETTPCCMYLGTVCARIIWYQCCLFHGPDCIFLGFICRLAFIGILLGARLAPAVPAPHQTIPVYHMNRDTMHSIASDMGRGGGGGGGSHITHTPDIRRLH